MSGNVYEWCWDWYGPYSDQSVVDPRGPLNGTKRVRRGGGWVNYARFTRASARGCHLPSNHDYFIGFRLVRSLYDNIDEEDGETENESQRSSHEQENQEEPADNIFNPEEQYTPYLDSADLEVRCRAYLALSLRMELSEHDISLRWPLPPFDEQFDSKLTEELAFSA